MNVKSVVENKEKYEVELIIEVGHEEFEAGLEKAYRKNRSSISVPGFRKGKAPRKVIEGMYGPSVFYEDALEELYPQACEDAIKEKELDSVAPPKVEIMDLGKDGFTFKATVTVCPVVTLKQYKGLEADKVLPTVTEEAVDNELKQYIDRVSQLEPVDRPAELGDTVAIDYEGFESGVPFQGGSAQNYDLTLGSHSFIPGFEDQVVGMKAGEDKVIDVTFPEDYHSEDLAGKPVMFKVKCVEVKTKKTPNLDDEFAKDVSEFDTLAEFKDDLKQKIIDRNMAQSEAKFRQGLLTLLSDQVEIELPEAMVETKINSLMDNYAARLEQQGISLEMYMSYMQTSVEQMRAELKDGAIKQIKQQLALDAVAAAENIAVSDADVEEEIKKAVDSLKIPYEKAVEGLDRESLKKDLARDRAMTMVASEAKAHLISVDSEDGDIKLTEVTKDDETAKDAAAVEPKEAEETKTEEAEPAAKKPAKKAAKKTEEKAEGEEAAKPARKPRAKKTAESAEEGEKAPKKTTRKKKEEEAGE